MKIFTASLRSAGSGCPAVKKGYGLLTKSLLFPYYYFCMIAVKVYINVPIQAFILPPPIHKCEKA